jgi:pyruvate,orthophosphate dikinase
MPDRAPDPPLHLISPGEKPPARGARDAGNKAFNLMRMACAGLPVPPGFVLPTQWCALPRDDPSTASTMAATLAKGIGRIEAATGQTFGSGRRPLLVSVRSGAPVSMPGMMETVLDIGLNDETVEGMIRMTGDPRLAWDSFRRLVQNYAEVVTGLPTAPFEALLRATLSEAGVEHERELDYRAARELTRRMLACYRELAGEPFPSDPKDQLVSAVEAVFGSWNAPKARRYQRRRQFRRGRRLHPRSGHRRARILFRFPVQQPG